MSYYREPESHSRNKIKVELYLSNYTTKHTVKKQQVLIDQSRLKKLVYLV